MECAVEGFVRGLGGGQGVFRSCADDAPTGGWSSETFEQHKSAAFPRSLIPEPPELGLGFGRIKFEGNDHAVPYIRVPWSANNEMNEIRAQVPYFFQRSRLVLLVLTEYSTSDIALFCRARMETCST